MASIKIRLTGISPIILHSDKGANPLHPLVKEMKQITKKRTKTDEDHEDISKLQWYLALYYDEKVGPYVPGLNLDACIREAGKLTRKGKDIQRFVQTEEDMIPLIYDGPRNIDKLWKSGNFLDIRSVVIQKARTMSSRPIFFDWKLECNVNYNSQQINKDTLWPIIKSAGEMIGLCDYRPRYGRFEVEEI